MFRLDGEKFGVTERNPEDSSQTVLLEDVLGLANIKAFFESTTLMTQRK
jgi:hypothetical protein